EEMVPGLLVTVPVPVPLSVMLRVKLTGATAVVGLISSIPKLALRRLSAPPDPWNTTSSTYSPAAMTYCVPTCCHRNAERLSLDSAWPARRLEPVLSLIYVSRSPLVGPEFHSTKPVIW